MTTTWNNNTAKKSDQQQQQPQQTFEKKTTTTTNKYEIYKELLEIENENEIKVPKDLNGSIRALKHSLDNPVIIRPPYKDSHTTLNNMSRSVKTVSISTFK